MVDDSTDSHDSTERMADDSQSQSQDSFEDEDWPPPGKAVLFNNMEHTGFIFVTKKAYSIPWGLTVHANILGKLGRYGPNQLNLEFVMPDRLMEITTVCRLYKIRAKLVRFEHEDEDMPRAAITYAEEVADLRDMIALISYRVGR